MMKFAEATTLLLLLVTIATPCVSKPDMDWEVPEENDFIDPHDMLNYEIGKNFGSHDVDKPKVSTGKSQTADVVMEEKSKKDVPGEDGTNTRSTRSSPLHFNRDCKQLFYRLRWRRSPSQQKVAQCPKQEALETLYFRQYVKTFLSYVGYYTIQETAAFEMHIELGMKEYNVLKKFAEEKGSIQDAHAVMNNMIRKLDAMPDALGNVPEERWMFWYTVRDYAPTILMLACAIALILIAFWMQMHRPLPLGKLLIQTLVLLFVISVPWNWWHLYKLEITKRHVAVIKEMPQACKQQDETVWSIVSGFFTLKTDECTAFHEKMIVDPMWEVPPTKRFLFEHTVLCLVALTVRLLPAASLQALVVTVTKFILEPLEYLGEAFNKLIQASLKDLPAILWPYVLGVIILILVLLLIMMSGYKISILYFFGLEPATTKTDPKTLKCIESLTEEIKRLQENSEAAKIQYNEGIQSIKDMIGTATVAGDNRQLALQQPTSRDVLAITAGSETEVRPDYSLISAGRNGIQTGRRTAKQHSGHTVTSRGAGDSSGLFCDALNGLQELTNHRQNTEEIDASPHKMTKSCEPCDAENLYTVGLKELCSSDDRKQQNYAGKLNDSPRKTTKSDGSRNAISIQTIGHQQLTGLEELQQLDSTNEVAESLQKKAERDVSRNAISVQTIGHQELTSHEELQQLDSTNKISDSPQLTSGNSDGQDVTSLDGTDDITTNQCDQDSGWSEPDKKVKDIIQIEDIGCDGDTD